MGLCINPDCEKSRNQEDQGLNLFCTGCGSGLLINDLYRAVKLLGKGGFGITYLAEDCGAFKVLKILHHADPKAISLFDQEARVLQWLNHSGIPKVEVGGRFDYFPRGSQAPLRCLVMEYIEGETLEDYVKKNNYRPISEQAAVRWLRELMEILALVHSANYFHRDIKPAKDATVFPILAPVQRCGRFFTHLPRPGTALGAGVAPFVVPSGKKSTVNSAIQGAPDPGKSRAIVSIS